MIARHITSHDENGMRLLGIGREIHRTPTQQALENLAMDLASREGSVIYAQQRCMDGAAISREFGSAKFYNIALLGVAVASGRLGLDEAFIISAIENGVNPKFVEVNKKVFEYAMKM